MADEFKHEYARVGKRRGFERSKVPAGKKFGRWTVISEVPPPSHVKTQSARYFACKCDCGNESIVSYANFSNSKSCGCLRLERLLAVKKTHGLSKHPLYGVWKNMIDRCINPKCEEYKNYGERGISVCDEWISSPSAFVDWALSDKNDNRWVPGLSIDRIDVNGHYEPRNCRFTTSFVQNRNKRTNHLIEINGRKCVLEDAALEFGISSERILRRLQAGWPANLAVSIPVIPGNRLSKFL